MSAIDEAYAQRCGTGPGGEKVAFQEPKKIVGYTSYGDWDDLVFRIKELENAVNVMAIFIESQGHEFVKDNGKLIIRKRGTDV
jgi:hypothetical protein